VIKLWWGELLLLVYFTLVVPDVLVLKIRHSVIQNNIRKKEQQTFNTRASGTTNVKYTRSSNSPHHSFITETFVILRDFKV
jgi:hypothetical protein